MHATVCYPFWDKPIFFCERVLFETADGLVNRTVQGGENYGESSGGINREWYVYMYCTVNSTLDCIL
jgi:hypothetical protein